MTWPTFWSAVSAIFTAITALIAFFAMYRWRKQDELKAKLEFKKAISRYSYLLTQMPEQLNQPHFRQAYAQQGQALIDALSMCDHTWLVSEGLMEGNKTVKDSWEYLFDNNKNYLNGTLHSSELGIRCMGILHEKFVFK